MMQQLSSLTLELKPKEALEGPRRRGSLGPCLQGVLMEHVDRDYASMLHQLPFNPYSQHCYWEGDSLMWRVSALTSEAASQIIEPLRTLEAIEVRAVGASFEVARSSQETLPLKALLDTVAEPGDPKVRVQFLTPTAFKSKGSYVIMPSVRLILQNLLMHYGQVYDNDKEGYAETIEFVDKNVRLLAYNLRSCSFGYASGAGSRIPAFAGTMTLGLRGPEMTAGLVRMLLRFGEYAGVGIKTSMGMGGLRCLQTQGAHAPARDAGERRGRKEGAYGV